MRGHQALTAAALLLLVGAPVARSAGPSTVHVVIEGGANGSETDADGQTNAIAVTWHEESDATFNPVGAASAHGLVPFKDDVTKEALSGTADNSQFNCHGALTIPPNGLFDPSVTLDRSGDGYAGTGSLSWFLPIKTATWVSSPGPNCGGSPDFYLGAGAVTSPGTPVDLGATGTKTYENMGSIPVSGTGSLLWNLKLTVTVTPGCDDDALLAEAEKRLQDFGALRHFTNQAGADYHQQIRSIRAKVRGKAAQLAAVKDLDDDFARSLRRGHEKDLEALARLRKKLLARVTCPDSRAQIEALAATAKNNIEVRFDSLQHLPELARKAIEDGCHCGHF